MNQEQLERISQGKGFIAALDQSGGSTPKALKSYGVNEDAYSNEEEMFNQVHNMRTRIVTSDSFSGDQIIGAILFENTLHRDIEGKHSAAYLWEEKNIVPFLKIDKGLDEEINGAQCLKPIPELDTLLASAVKKGVFGTKMRSLIHQANELGIQAVVNQQFEVAKQIISHDLVPIIEPEVSIDCSAKQQAEEILKSAILSELNKLNDDQIVMLKLTIPNTDNFYKELIEHKNVVRVVALSGGYSREDANEKLSRNHQLIASFSRALSEGLFFQQSKEDFDSTLRNTITSIYSASIT